MYWKKLKTVNKEAAAYIDNLSPMEEKRIDWAGDEMEETCKVLPELFNFSKTPQGRDYWNDINMDCVIL